jgi:hypothetical protein
VCGTNSSASESAQLAGSCEHGNGPAQYMKARNYLLDKDSDL